MAFLLNSVFHVNELHILLQPGRNKVLVWSFKYFNAIDTNTSVLDDKKVLQGKYNFQF